MVKRILVGIGGTPFSAVATERAVELAKAHDAELTGISIVDVKRVTHIGPTPAGGAHLAKQTAERRLKETRERVEKAIAAFETACSDAKVRYTVEYEDGDPFDKLISHARYHELLVFGLRGLFDYGVVDEPKDALNRLILEGVRPIIAVAPVYRPIKKALFAYSGSMASAKTMRRFIQLNLWPDMEMRVVSYEDGAKEPPKILLEDARKVFDAYGLKVEMDAQEGSATDQLLEYAADYNADIIVLGDSSRSLFMRSLFGDTTLHLIRDAERALFLAH